MNIKIIKDAISIDEAKEISKEFYDDMVKGAIDIKSKVFALGGEYHIDAATVLTEKDSKPEDIWGFNIVFSRPKGERIEYTALINIKPGIGNRDMFIADAAIRKIIGETVESKLI